MLYTDTAIGHDDFFLNSTESLHPLHADNLRKHLVKQEFEGRSAGLRIKEVQGLPTFAEVTKVVDKIKADEKVAEAKMEAKMRLAEAAAGSTGGGVGVTQSFHHDALLAAMSSRSRFY